MKHQTLTAVAPSVPPGTIADPPAPAPHRAVAEPPVRVLQVVLSLRPGGTEHLVMEICRRLGPGFHTTVCCLDDEGAWAPALRADGIEVVALGRRAGFRPALGRRIADLAAARGATVLHCHQYSPFVYGRIAAYWRPGLKIAYTEHGRLSDAPPSWKRRLANTVLSRFDGPIVVVSDELRGYLATAWIPPGRIRVIHNGIEAGGLPTPADRRRARRSLGIGDDAFVIITVARLDPVKDLGSLLDAVAIVRRETPHARLVVVGDGPERPALAERAACADLAGAVDFVGMRSDVRALLPAADVFANSSISEGISITILEAMAAGVPVVATMAGGNPEALGDGAAGVLVPARSSGRLAAALAALAVDPPRRAAVARAGRQRVKTMFTIERMVAEYARVYRQLVGRR